MVTIKITVERTEKRLWGTVEYDDDLIVDDADSIESLKENLKVLLHDFHDLNPEDIEFEIVED